MAQYRLKTLTTEHLPDLKIGGGGVKIPENLLHIYTKEDMVVVNKSFNSETHETAYDIYIVDDYIYGNGHAFTFTNYNNNVRDEAVGAIVDKNESAYMVICLMPAHRIPTAGEDNEKNKAELETNFFLWLGDYEAFIPQ